MAVLNVKMQKVVHIHKTETKYFSSTYAQFAHIENMVKNISQNVSFKTVTQSNFLKTHILIEQKLPTYTKTQTQQH